jgi:hypothetical protein
MSLHNKKNRNVRGDNEEEEYKSIKITSDENDELSYIPLIYNIPKTKSMDIIESIYESTFSLPRMDLGFHHYNHATKDKMEIVHKLATKRKFYGVINKFDTEIDGDPEHSVSTLTKEFFDFEKTKIPSILSRGFYKMWELIKMFKLVPVDTDNFVSAHLAEGPGAFTQATILYRDTYIKKKYSTKNDKYYAITIHTEDDIGRNHVPKMERQFVEYYTNEKPQRLFIHKTYPLDVVKEEKKIAKQNGGAKPKIDNGDLTKVDTVINFGNDLKNKKANLVTADGGMNWKNENTQEQESLMLIFGQICTALVIQEDGGTFILKLFESFTTVILQLIVILNQLYDDVIIVKPLMSRDSNSEKYIICKKYKGYKKNIELIKQLLNTLKHWKSNTYLVNLNSDYEFDNKFINTMVSLNTEIANRQIESINKIFIFIKKQDYYGQDYNIFKNNQIASSQYWTKTFLTKEEQEDIYMKYIDLAVFKSKNRIELLNY